MPANANIWIDKQYFGKTPLCVNLSRKQDHEVLIELEGYEPYRAQFHRGVSGWVIGNVIIGGPIGIAVDAYTGAIYKLKPEDMRANLGSQCCASSKLASETYVAVVMQPDPKWEKIGSLKAQR